jgi:SAM-dependent methyltransferase
MPPMQDNPYEKIRRILRCPQCEAALDQQFCCAACNASYMGSSGRLDFMKNLDGNASERWRHAQETERAFWSTFYRRNPPQMDRIQAFFGRSSDRFGFPVSEFSGKTVLEVGCGPYGFFTGLSHAANEFSDAATLIGLDPLLEVYADFEVFSYACNDVLRFSATGETLPFVNASVDVIVCQNVLDHVDRPDIVLNEFKRVLKPGGCALIDVHTIAPFVAPLKTLLDRIDPPHPHHFVHHGLRKTLAKQGFVVEHARSVSLFTDHPFYKLLARPKQFAKMLVANLLFATSYYRLRKP